MWLIFGIFVMIEVLRFWVRCFMFVDEFFIWFVMSLCLVLKFKRDIFFDLVKNSVLGCYVYLYCYYLNGLLIGGGFIFFLCMVILDFGLLICFLLIKDKVDEFNDLGIVL